MKRIIRLIAYGLFLIFVIPNLNAGADADLFQITVINVGKGDCILVQTGDHTVMIDTGYQETSHDVLDYLNKYGIQKLDALIISHFDKDHVGGAADILSKIPADVVYMPDYDGTKDGYRNMLSVIAENGIPVHRLTEAFSFQLSSAEYEIYPSGVPWDPDEGNDNDLSITVSVRYNGHSAFFAGDLEEAGIESLAAYAKSHSLNISCDILKLPHHGRIAENSAYLLDLINPEIALITDGSSRRADGEMIDMLNDRDIDYYCSAVDGTYVITASGTSDYSIDITNKPELQTSGLWLYTVSADGTAEIIGYTGNDEALDLPSELDGRTVTGIADSAFFNHTELISVTIPDTVTSVGNSAFSWCSKLQNITLSGNITHLGNGAFYYCEKLKSIVLPEGITTIGEYTFFHCKKLTDILIPETVIIIGEKAFAHCNNLETITIPSGVTEIEEDAFQKCKRLKSIVIQPGIKSLKPYIFADNESLASVRIPATVVTIEAYVFSNCPDLHDIYYEGTEEMWNAVNKAESWDAGIPADKTIHFLSLR